MVLLNTDAFLMELHDLYRGPGVDGSVFVTVKPHVVAAAAPSGGHGKQQAAEPCALVRATCGKKKISTLVHARDHVKFQLAYANILRTYCSPSLQKSARKQKRKGRASAQS